MNYSSLDLAILKTLITNKKHAIDFATECDAKLFSVDLWNFSKVIVDYVKVFKEVPTLRVIQDRMAKTGNKTFAEYCDTVWKAVDAHPYDEREFKFDLEKIKQRYAEKQLAEIKESLNKSDFEKLDVEKSLQDIQKKVQNIKSLKQTKAYERRTLKDNIALFRDEFNEKLQNPDYGQGIQTGYSFLDSATGGLNPGELVLIGGESGAGKSLLLMNIAIQMWLGTNTLDMRENFRPGNDVLYFSLEMPYKPCFNRVLSRLSKVGSKRIRQPLKKDGRPNMSTVDKGKLRNALQFIDKYPHEFEIIDIPRGTTPSKVELLFEEAKEKFNPKIIVIDYLGIMDDDSDKEPESDWLKLGTIAGKVHEFGRVHDVIVLSAVQLNRAKSSGKDASADDKVGMHRIGRSGLIMTHANIGIQIESRKNEKDYPEMYYHLIKNRDGEMGKGKLIKDLACGSLIDDPIKEDKNKEEKEIEEEFTDLDDLTGDVDLLDI